MLSAGESYESRHGSRFTVVEGPADNGGARIVLDRVMSANRGTADPHVHLDCDQHYEIQSGTATIEIAGHKTGRLTDQDELPVLMILVLTRAYDGHSFRTGIPIGTQKAILPLMAAIGRMRGFQPSPE